MQKMADVGGAANDLTFKKAAAELYDFACEEGIQDLTRGGSAEKAATFSMSGNALFVPKANGQGRAAVRAGGYGGSGGGGGGRVCYRWQSEEGCGYGDTCFFDHTGLASWAQARDHPSGVAEEAAEETAMAVTVGLVAAVEMEVVAKRPPTATTVEETITRRCVLRS
jgi:hypothetical protein